MKNVGAIDKTLRIVAGVALILLAVGMLIGSWILCGTVPAMIYYGVEVLNPSVFYAASAAICALVAISVGSSWTVAGTLGIGLVGIAGGAVLLFITIVVALRRPRSREWFSEP